MSATIQCPNCRTPFTVLPQTVGQVVTCPACQGPIRLVAQPDGPAGPPARPAGSSPAVLIAVILGVTGVLVTGLISIAAVWLLLARGEESETVASKSVTTNPVRPDVPAPLPATPPTPMPMAAPIPAPGFGLPSVPTPAPPSFPAAPPPVASPVASSAESPAAASSSPAPPLPASDPAKILGALGSAWQLPALLSTAPLTVATLVKPPSEPLDLAITSLAADLPAEGVIFSEPASEPNRWNVLYVANSTALDEQILLAEIALAGNEFRYVWNAAAAATLRRQVANCSVDLRHGDERCTVQLRAPLAHDPCLLDLEKVVQVLEFPLLYPPKEDALRIELVSLEQFSGSPTLPDASLALGKTTKIEFNDPPGAELMIRFQQSGDRFMLRLEPQFRENGSNTFDMTLPELQDMEQGISRALAKARQELPVQLKIMKQANSDVDYLQKHQPRNIAERPGWTASMAVARKKLTSANTRANQLQRQIPLHEARLAAVPTIRTFLTSLHGKAAIRFRLVADCGQSSIVLVDGTSAAPANQQQ